MLYHGMSLSFSICASTANSQNASTSTVWTVNRPEKSTPRMWFSFQLFLLLFFLLQCLHFYHLQLWVLYLYFFQLHECWVQQTIYCILYDSVYNFAYQRWALRKKKMHNTTKPYEAERSAMQQTEPKERQREIINKYWKEAEQKNRKSAALTRPSPCINEKIIITTHWLMYYNSQCNVGLLWFCIFLLFFHFSLQFLLLLSVVVIAFFFSSQFHSFCIFSFHTQ